MENSRLNRLLLVLVGTEELVDLWWESPNKAFDGNTPKEMLAKQPETVVQYIVGQFNGDYL